MLMVLQVQLQPHQGASNPKQEGEPIVDRYSIIPASEESLTATASRHLPKTRSLWPREI